MLITLANLSDVAFVTSGATVTATGTTNLSTVGFYYIDAAGVVNLGLPLPANVSFNNLLFVKDTSGAAATNAINILGRGGALIDGRAQYTIEQDFGSVMLSWNGTGWSVMG